jgi:hypothetical protein
MHKNSTSDYNSSIISFLTSINRIKYYFIAYWFFWEIQSKYNTRINKNSIHTAIKFKKSQNTPSFISKGHQKNNPTENLLSNITSAQLSKLCIKLEDMTSKYQNKKYQPCLNMIFHRKILSNPKMSPISLRISPMGLKKKKIY